MTHPLDDPLRASLTGPHAHLAVRRGGIVRYLPEVSSFISIPAQMSSQDWADVADLVPSGGVAAFFGVVATPPEGWVETIWGEGYQLVGEDVAGKPDEEAVRLGPADVPEMLDLVARTAPGPFAPRTIELGTYLGFRRDGALVAMAGQRMHPPGWIEISAVCTAEEYRGQGLASRLIGALVADIRDRGAVPFLHATTQNPAVRLYESLGFRRRRTIEFAAFVAPGHGDGAAALRLHP